MAKSNYLTPLESLIYNRIKFFTEQGEYKYCSQSNGTLSKYFNRPKESISRTIAKLKKLGYITEEKDGTLRKLFSTNKENIYNYAVNTNDEVVNTNDEVVNTNDEVVNIDDKVVILKSLLNDEVVIKAMTKSLTSDDEVVKHNIKILSIELNKDLNKDNLLSKKEIYKEKDLKENNNKIITKEKKLKDIWTEEEITAFGNNLNKKLDSVGLKDFDRKFCQDMFNKFTQYGDNMLITEKQLVILETVFS